MRVALGDGELVTCDGGAVRTSAALRDKVAIFAGGRCLISREHADDVDVISLIALARRLGFPTKSPEFVDLGSLRNIYSDGALQPSLSFPDKPIHDDTAMQREVQGLLSRAAAVQASDIHIVVDSDFANVRVRIDGELQPMASGAGSSIQWRAEHGHQICLTAYAMAAEGGTADSNYDPFGYQAGRIMTGLPHGVQAVRLQFNPVGYNGRHLVMRLLYTGHAAGHSIRDLGFSTAQIETLIGFIENKTGIVVISGPTGSGKTTTLERLMRRIVESNPGDSVLSVEDPPEYKIPGVIQLPVSNMRNDADRDDAYTEAIAAALRSDPDRIMIGEVRTRAAAHHAFEAAMTGHQVLTTVHANDALGIVPRLMDIGVETYKLRDSSLLRGLVAQRLVRRLCPHCRRQSDPKSADLPSGMAKRLQVILECHPFWLPGVGCGFCRRGYGGRTVLGEIIRPDQKLLDLLCAGERQAASRYWLGVLGGQTFSQHAIEKIIEGVIDPIQAEHKIGRLAEQ
jgi:type II secretory ATPase GspE/PulE/Tfp pilus assembly ATPase PilB-like protein